MARLLSTAIQPYTHFCCGSLPFTDAEAAIDFIWERPWIVPFWPELPARDPRERMVGRDERAGRPDWSGYLSDEALGLYMLEARVAANRRRLPMLKSQCCGPYTLARYGMLGGETLPERMQIAVEAVRRVLRWQAEKLQPLAENVLIVLDEPACTEAFSAGGEVRNTLFDAYSYLYVSASESGVALGLHACGNFEPLLCELPFDLFSVDLSGGNFERLTQSAQRSRWRRAIDEGRVVVPGVFSAQTPADFEAEMRNGDLRLAALREYFGAERTNFLVAATCGHVQSSRAWLECLYESAHRQM